MKTRHLLCSLSIIFMLLVQSCEKNEFVQEQAEGNVIPNVNCYAGELVPVQCSFNVIPFSVTKAEDYVQNELEINNFWLLQFDGTAENSKFLAAIYHPHVNGETDLAKNYVKMAEEYLSQTKTVWIIANIGQTDVAGNNYFASYKTNETTLKEFWSDGFPLSESLQLKTLNGGNSYYRSGTQTDAGLAIPLSGSCEFDSSDLQGIDANKGLVVTLKSIVAKLTIDISGVAGTLETIKLFRVPAKVSYAPDKIESVIGSTTYKSLVYEYCAEDYIANESASKSITLYVPQNLQQNSVFPANTSAKTKTENAPAKATYISLGVLYDGKHVSVNIYPGGDGDSSPNNINSNDNDNQYDNYNIRANTHYSEKIKISSTGVYDSYLGDNLLDSRLIEKLLQSVTSNCYILNPLMNVSPDTYVNGAINMEEYYALPVVARVNEAWYNKNTGNCIGENDEWRLEVIWQDVPGRQIYFSESSGLKAWKNTEGAIPHRGNASDNSNYATYYYGKGNGYNGFAYIFVEPETKTDRTAGNVLVALRKRNTNATGYETEDYGQIIWSWHLWVTDYNPDKAGNWSSGYNKNVPGDANADGTRDAKVFHYKFWTTGNSYDYDWIMDRHLGALGWRPAGMFGVDANPEEHEAYGLYYQWGRKDPFPAQRLLNNRYYQNSTNIPEGYSNYRVSEIELYTIDGSKSSTSIKGSVGLPSNSDIFNTALEPTQLYNIQDITTYDGQKWNSPGAKGFPTNSEDTEIVGTYSSMQGTKTLFDPCPAGWELPNNDAYLGRNTIEEGFVISTTTNAVNNIYGRYATKFHEIESIPNISGTNLQYEVNNGAWEIRADGGGSYKASTIEHSCSHALGSQNDNSTYFPCSGWLMSSGYKDMQGIGDIWCANEKNATLGSYLYIGRGVGNTFESSGRVLYIDYPIISGNKDIGYSKNNGFSVRCVKRKSN